MRTEKPTAASVRARSSCAFEGRFHEHLAEAALEVIGGDVELGEGTDRGALGIAHGAEYQVLDAEVGVVEGGRWEVSTSA